VCNFDFSRRFNFSSVVIGCRTTSPRYKQFGTKLSPLFGFAKSSKYKPIFPLSQIPKLLVACVSGSAFSQVVLLENSLTVFPNCQNHILKCWKLSTREFRTFLHFQAVVYA
jgi:hypothetical protein